MLIFKRNKNFKILELNCIVFLFLFIEINIKVFKYFIKLNKLELSNWNLSQWSFLNFFILFVLFKELIIILKFLKVGFEMIFDIIWEMLNLKIVILSNNKILSLDL